MGVGLNTMLAAVGAGGVAASKVGTAISENAKSSSNNESNESSAPISQANDGELAEKMADKARKNALANIKNILAQRDISDRARNRRIGKELKTLQGGNK